MGGACSNNSICSSPDRVTTSTLPDAIGGTQRTHNTVTSTTDLYRESTDSDYDSTAHLDPSYGEPPDGHRDITPQPSHSAESQQKALIGFKDAVQNGNESLVMYYAQEFSEMDLLQSTTFETGDNCLQIAVRNKSYNLILYLLTNGVSV